MRVYNSTCNNFILNLACRPRSGVCFKEYGNTKTFSNDRLTCCVSRMENMLFDITASTISSSLRSLPALHPFFASLTNYLLSHSSNSFTPGYILNYNAIYGLLRPLFHLLPFSISFSNTFCTFSAFFVTNFAPIAARKIISKWHKFSIPCHYLH